MQMGYQLKSLLKTMGHSFDSFLSCLTEYFLLHKMFWPRHCGGTSLKSRSNCAKIAAATSSVCSFEKTSDLSVSISGPLDPTNHRTFRSQYLLYTYLKQPVVPHKAVAEVSKIGHYRRGELSSCTDGSPNPRMDWKMVGTVYFSNGCNGCNGCSGHLNQNCWM